MRPQEFNDVVPTPVGWVAVTVRDGRVASMAFGAVRSRPARRGDIRRWLSSWFAGTPLRLPLDLSGATPFERRVYAVVRRISRGRTLTYGEVALRAGHPGAARAVGRALARNPVALLIP